MKFLLVFFSLFFLFSCFLFASDGKNEDIIFVKKFVERIYDDRRLSLADESYFLGSQGGVPGTTLRLQLATNTEIKALLKKHRDVSLIGTLLQMEKEKIFYPGSYGGPTYWGIVDQDGFRQPNAELIFPVTFSYTYVIMLKALRKDVMSLENSLRLCIIAVDKNANGARMVNLLYSTCNGQRLLDILGFVPYTEFPDIKLSRERLDRLNHFLRKENGSISHQRKSVAK